MMAKKKPIEKKTLDDLGVSPERRISYLRFELPPAREAGVKVASVEELMDKLRNEAKVI
jgi:electron transfer flavoprotein beta subunit